MNRANQLSFDANELLRQKLEAEGLFSENRKRAIPYMPQKIGIITSQDAAAYKDFMKVYTEQLKKSNLKAKFRETGDPLVQIYAGSETKSNLLLQIRVKVEAASSNSKDGKVYRPYMRNYVEAGPLMFALLN